MGKCIFQKFLSTARVYTTATAAEQGSKVYKEHKDRLKIISWNPYSHHSEKKKKQIKPTNGPGYFIMEKSRKDHLTP